MMGGKVSLFLAISILALAKILLVTEVLNVKDMTPGAATGQVLTSSCSATWSSLH